MIKLKMLDGFNKYTDYILESFFSKKFYREVFFSWQGYAIIYVIFLISIVQLFAIYKPISIIFKLNENKISNILTSNENKSNHDDINHMVAEIIKQIPELKFESGHLKSPIKEARKILHPNSEEIFMVIDTEKKEQDQINLIAPITILSDQLIFGRYDNSTNGFIPLYKYSFSNQLEIDDHEEIIINDEFIIKMIPTIKKTLLMFFALVYFPGLSITAAILYLSDSLFMALVAFFYLKFTNSKCDLQPIFRVSAISKTPAIILSVIFDNYIFAGTAFLSISEYLWLILGVYYFYYFLSYNIKLKTGLNQI